MMVDIHFARACGTHDVGHGTELRPGAGVDDDVHVALHIRGIDVSPEYEHIVIRVDEADVRRYSVAVYDPHGFAERAQREGQAQLAADRITVRPHVAGEYERSRFVDYLREWAPINRHVV